MNNTPPTPPVALSVGYDKAGNMTTMPKVGSWTAAQTLTWDAWNRLTKVQEASTVIGEYQYDGLTRRVWKKSTESGWLLQRHFYYSDKWQVLEERLGSNPTSALAERQFIWGLRYLDDLILRDVFAQASSSSGSPSTSGS